MIEKALKFAIEAHSGQMRKDGVTPYIVHPIGVADRVRQRGGDQAMICAAYLHDVVEDCDVELEDIYLEFGDDIGDLVDELTDVYTKENYPVLNRAERKKKEVSRLSQISERAKMIKLADVDYNVNDLAGMKGFAHRLLEEKVEYLKALKNADLGYATEILVAINNKLPKA